MIILDNQSRLPIYEQLKNRIAELVLTGVYPPDMQLPSVRSLARELGVNPNTVQKAYQELEREQVIYTVGGKGCFISTNPLIRERRCRETLDRLTAAVRECHRAGIPAEEIRRAVSDTVDRMGEEDET